MARPTKWRRVEFVPSIQYFTPSDTSCAKLGENVLRIEELEAIRLKDLEGLEQIECAERMEISRQTFQRILGIARQKIADSLIGGKAIKIEGGTYTRNICSVKCLDCKKQWNESYENFKKILNGQFNCPQCGSQKITCFRDEEKRFCRRNCWRGGRKQESDS
ncbi:MAG: DUF134 domain-containing protein [Clostridium sp.]|nr:DUF134 domain-containing protein [Clostridium sp.]